MHGIFIFKAVRMYSPQFKYFWAAIHFDWFINLIKLLCRNAEDIRREDPELHSSSHHVLTLDGEVMAVNGKLLAGHVYPGDDLDLDQTSVCSCNCLGLNHCENQELLLDSSYYPSHTVLASNLKIKRASVWMSSCSISSS